MLVYRVSLINDPFSTSSQGRIIEDIDMRFDADFFSYRIHEDTLKIVEMRAI